MSDTTNPTFSLSALVAEIWEVEQIEDVRDLTRKVIAAIPAAHLDDVFERAMRNEVHRILGKIRQSATAPDLGGEDVAPRNTSTPPSKPRAGRSTWKDHAAAYRRFLSAPESVGDNLTKPIGDLTRDEVLAAAERRMQNASANMAVAARYERIAGLMSAHSATTVSDLPSDLVMGAL